MCGTHYFLIIGSFLGGILWDIVVVCVYVYTCSILCPHSSQVLWDVYMSCSHTYKVHVNTVCACVIFYSLLRWSLSIGSMQRGGL